MAEYAAAVAALAVVSVFPVLRDLIPKPHDSPYHLFVKPPGGGSRCWVVFRDFPRRQIKMSKVIPVLQDGGLLPFVK